MKGSCKDSSLYFRDSEVCQFSKENLVTHFQRGMVINVVWATVLSQIRVWTEGADRWDQVPKQVVCIFAIGLPVN